MARVDVKGLSRRIERFKKLAIAFSDADRKTRTKRPNSLRVAEANELFDALLSEAISLVGVLMTTDDGEEGVPTLVAERHVKRLHEAIDKDPPAWAVVFRALEERPYDRIFKRAEKEAAR